MKRNHSKRPTLIVLAFSLVLSLFSTLIFPDLASADMLSSEEAKKTAQRYLAVVEMASCSQNFKNVDKDERNDLTKYVDGSRRYIQEDNYAMATAWFNGVGDGKCVTLMNEFYNILGEEYKGTSDPQWNFMKSLGYDYNDDRSKVVKPSGTGNTVQDRLYAKYQVPEKPPGFTRNAETILGFNLPTESKYWIAVSYISQVCSTPSADRPTDDSLFIREVVVVGSDGKTALQFVGCPDRNSDVKAEQWIREIAPISAEYARVYDREVRRPAQARAFGDAFCASVGDGREGGGATVERDSCYSRYRDMFYTCVQPDDSGVIHMDYAVSCLAERTGETELRIREILNNALAVQPENADVPQHDPSTASDPMGEGTTTCSPEIGGLGWLVCPVMNFIAMINDNLYEFISSMLAVPPELTVMKDPTTQEDSGTYTAWKVFRNIANILFIIAMLVVVYSQLTSAGISNYGIKKMLPKLIIAAIAVNISYFLCQLAIDLSNILGFSIKEMFDSIGAQIPSAGSTQNTWASNIAGVLTGVVIGVALGLAISFPVIIAAVLSLAAAAMILVAQKALIVLLIVVSPVAFALYLLPNTESLLKKWWQLFKSLLLLFPTMSLLFGAGALAANILATIDTPGMQIAALGATAIPLAGAIPLLQGALKQFGSAGAKLGGLASAKRVGNKIKDDSRLGRGVTQAFANRKKQRNIRQDRINARAPGTRRVFGVIGGRGYTERMESNAAKQEDAEYEEGVANATIRQQADMTHDQIMAAALTGTNHEGRRLTDHERDAAIRYRMDKGNVEERLAMLSHAGSVTTYRQRRSLADGARAKGDHKLVGNGFLGNVVGTTDRGGFQGMDHNAVQAAAENAIVENLNNGVISPETITETHRHARLIGGYTDDHGTHHAGLADRMNQPARAALHTQVERYLDTDVGQKLDNATRESAGAI